MLILALEFSSPVRTVALVKQSPETGAVAVLSQVSDDGARSAKPLEMLERLFTRAGVGPESTEQIVVGLGPGSYTGIRSSIAIAQGWHLAWRTKLVGISSVEALAHQAQAHGCVGRVSFIIDAQRGDAYLAQYQVSAGECVLIQPLHLIPIASLKTQLDSPDSIWAGPEVTRWTSRGQVLFPEAQILARLVAQGSRVVQESPLEPIYLRETTFVKAPPPRAMI